MLTMKQTIGRYIKLNDDDYPFKIEFDDFYYYEAVTGEHLLLHTLTGKRSMSFYITSTSFTILDLINMRFGLDLESIKLEGYYSATKNSEFFRVGTSGSSGFLTGSIRFNISWDWLVTDIPEDKKETVKNYVKSLLNIADTPDIDIKVSDGINGYARPPTE